MNPLFLVRTKGVISVLTKYVAMVEDYSDQVLNAANEVGALGPQFYLIASTVLTDGMFGTLLPELCVGLTVLLLQAPLLLSESECIPRLSSLLKLLDSFNRLAHNCDQVDEEDIVWDEVSSKHTLAISMLPLVLVGKLLPIICMYKILVL